MDGKIILGLNMDMGERLLLVKFLSGHQSPHIISSRSFPWKEVLLKVFDECGTLEKSSINGKTFRGLQRIEYLSWIFCGKCL